MSWLSHELRTPLTAIQGYASTLCQPDRRGTEESTERFLRSIAAESARAWDVSSATCSTRGAIESGILRLARDWCDLDLVVEAAAAVRPRRRQASALEVDAGHRTDLGRPRPARAGLREPPGERGAPRRLLGAHQVAVRPADDGQAIVIRGARPRPGHPRLAENFARARCSCPTCGRGLGARDRRGIIAAARLARDRPREPPRRSRCRSSPPESGADTAARDAAGGALGCRDPTCVLVVEDDRNIVDLIRSNLIVRGSRRRRLRATARTRSTPGRRAAGHRAPRPDAPGRDGFELCRQIRERSPVGIIVVSARRGETDKVRALNLGADDYMTKPFGIDELLARITATLRRSRPARPRRPSRSFPRRRPSTIDLGASR